VSARPYTGRVTAEAHHYDDLHRLVDRLNPGQADALRAVALQLVTATGAGDDADPDEQPVRHFSFAGSISAEPDFAERSEDILNEMVRRNAG